ncbi:MAG TPA: cyclic nucleotide-binding domain-containing protein, partial [Candidatus Methylomirabilis sp.]|nr:cyclic nucleotide-binding domain-containing protein [Candidatus Methylomirabilis sp.]
LAILVAVLALPPVIALIPRVVIAGMLAVISVQLVDRWTLQMIRKMIGGRVVHWRRMVLDLFVIALVATSAIALNLVTAVGIGVLVAILSFLTRMSRSVIRRAYRGDAMHSRRTLDPRLMEVLSVDGARILVFELEGALFFGTAEDLAKRVEAAVEDDVACVILDLNRINEVDSTGARILLQIHERLRRDGRHLLLSHLRADDAVGNVLNDMGVTAAVTAEKVFEDTDRALEWAEDDLIRSRAPDVALAGERAFEEMDILDGLDDGECAMLRGLLVRREYRRGDVVFQEGEEGRELFLIASGAASVKLRLSGEGRANRLATFSSGTVFGELALLDPGPRSASVEADEQLICYVLTDEAFDRLKKDHPAVAIKLVGNLGRELSRRLRRANRTIYQLES